MHMCINVFRGMTQLAFPLSLPLPPRRECPPSQIVPVRPLAAPCGLHTIKSYNDIGRKYLWNMIAWQCSCHIGILDVSGMYLNINMCVFFASLIDTMIVPPLSLKMLMLNGLRVERAHQNLLGSCHPGLAID